MHWQIVLPIGSQGVTVTHGEGVRQAAAGIGFGLAPPCCTEAFKTELHNKIQEHLLRMGTADGLAAWLREECKPAFHHEAGAEGRLRELRLLMPEHMHTCNVMQCATTCLILVTLFLYLAPARHLCVAYV